jgi:hypothetical protein
MSLKKTIRRTHAAAKTTHQCNRHCSCCRTCRRRSCSRTRRRPRLITGPAPHTPRKKKKQSRPVNDYKTNASESVVRGTGRTNARQKDSGGRDHHGRPQRPRACHWIRLTHAWERTHDRGAAACVRGVGENTPARAPRVLVSRQQQPRLGCVRVRVRTRTKQRRIRRRERRARAGSKSTPRTHRTVRTTDDCRGILSGARVRGMPVRGR